MDTGRTMPGTIGASSRRAMVGAGFRAAAQHSQMLTPLFTHIPGLKVVCPSTPYDTKGMPHMSARVMS